MRIAMTGGTGFLGRALIQRLAREGHQLVVWTRNPDKVPSLLGADVEAVSTEASADKLVQGADAVINLAGENLAGGRWNAKRRQALLDSRAQTTREVVAAIARVSPRPRVLLSASGANFYGDSGGRVLDENEPLGQGFLAEICRQWEDAASEATQHGVRVVRFRMGVILGRDGGALPKMLPAFKTGLGGRIGSGRQYVPWIHIDDAVEAYAQALTAPWQGPINLAAPEPVPQKELISTLARVLHRPTLGWVPRPVIRAALGEGAQMLLDSVRVVPQKLQEAGFAFQYPQLEDALTHLIRPAPGLTIVPFEGPSPLPDDLPEPQYVLENTLRVEAPIEKVFDFFSRPENLGLITPSWLRFAIQRRPEHGIGESAQIEYRVQIRRMRTSWVTRIRAWQPPHGFVDEQLQGPYRLWWHEHRLEPDGEGTRMVDRIYYSIPGGRAGKLVHRLSVEKTLLEIFSYRTEAIARRYGGLPGRAREVA